MEKSYKIHLQVFIYWQREFKWQKVSPKNVFFSSNFHKNRKRPLWSAIVSAQAIAIVWLACWKFQLSCMWKWQMLIFHASEWPSWPTWAHIEPKLRILFGNRGLHLHEIMCLRSLQLYSAHSFCHPFGKVRPNCWGKPRPFSKQIIDQGFQDTLA